MGAAIHMVDLLIFLTKQRPINVYAIGSDKLTQKSKFKKKSFVLLFLEFSSGLIAKISANGVADHPHFHELKIFSHNQTLLHTSLGTTEIRRSNFKLAKFNYPDKKNRKKLIQSFINLIIKKKNNNLFL